MITETDPSLAVLVVEDVAETRDGIEKLLRSDGYRVAVARDEQDAIESAQLKLPDLILVSLAGLPREVVLSARGIRDRAGLEESVPVVVFCGAGIAEGDEVAIGQNVHVTRPDNFNQLRSLITRLLRQIPKAASVQTNAIVTGENFMSTNGTITKPFILRFLDARSTVLLELTNATEELLRSVEILTIFLKDEETPGGGPSQAHIRFGSIDSMQAREKAVLSHRTWINGKPADADGDQLGRLKVVEGEASPYVLDISWKNALGKTHFQRIPVGH